MEEHCLDHGGALLLACSAGFFILPKTTSPGSGVTYHGLSSPTSSNCQDSPSQTNLIQTITQPRVVSLQVILSFVDLTVNRRNASYTLPLGIVLAFIAVIKCQISILQSQERFIVVYSLEVSVCGHWACCFGEWGQWRRLLTSWWPGRKERNKISPLMAGPVKSHLVVSL